MCESFKQEYERRAEFEITLVEQGSSDAKNMILGDVHNAPDVFTMVDDQLLSLIAAGTISPVRDAETVSDENVAEAAGKEFSMDFGSGWYMYSEE